MNKQRNFLNYFIKMFPIGVLIFILLIASQNPKYGQFIIPLMIALPILFIIVLFLPMVSYRLLDRGFDAEMKEVVQRYQGIEFDAESSAQALHDFTAIKNKPKSKIAKNNYYQSLATVYSLNNMYPEAYENNAKISNVLAFKLPGIRGNIGEIKKNQYESIFAREQEYNDSQK
ncbi:hypothetical protein G7062_06305 [Erysipelothrix sp. HDW6C]|uniref:hypothetical protein n=1 Tax=Erysipelothrix sp. HDW6C TaxID=2714930 RepID=UPI00140DDECF|nr:hypothetical protein [Erysipelothrix sp. HDW6C]QIK69921.1 hypothetical protein G7062_06305 [Erysipelothrix sp. HDW6C]